MAVMEVKLTGLRAIFYSHYHLLAKQLVDSSHEGTRKYWRAKCGFDEKVQNDPRSLRDVARDYHE